MTDIPATAAQRVAELRRAFDEAFASPPRAKTEEVEDLLTFRIEGNPYGLSIREIAGVAAAGERVPLPSGRPGLLGITGLRGALVPVYSLPVLMGYGPSRTSPRWLALCGARDPLALALGDLDGYARIPGTALHVPDREPRKHVHRLARIGETVSAIISVSSIVSEIIGKSSIKEE